MSPRPERDNPAVRLALLLLLLLTGAAAMDPDGKGPKSFDPEDDQDNAHRAFERVQEKAAAYRLARAAARPDPADDAASAQTLREARAFLISGDRHVLGLISATTWARWHAMGGFDDHPYAAGAGDLLAFAVQAAAEGNDVGKVYDILVQLWYYLPDYANIGDTMEVALAAAERAQDFTTHVDLAADKPSQVVDIDGRGHLDAGSKLFRFLSENGDRESVAPRAALGLARSYLLSSSREERWYARVAYDQFIERFPNHPLAFDALVENALAHLATYRGDRYDVGALLDASAIIDVAELETGNDAERARTIAAYRRRIGAWLQDRDLSVARWYAARGQPVALQWLCKPPDLADWQAGSVFYLRQVLARDPGSPQAHAAERELADLTLAAPRPLGKPLP